MTDDNSSTLPEKGQFFTFTLAQEVFAVDIAQVREVLEFTETTKIPRTPPSMCGVINLRGHVVPVVDLRLKFGMPSGERTVNTCIIILDVALDDGDSAVLGVLVDTVQEVLDLDAHQMEPPPKIGTHLRTDFIRAMGKQDEAFIIILDTNKIFSADEVSVATAQQAA